MNYTLIALLIWNTVVALVYAVDKIKAKKGTRRIRESTLLLVAFLLGGMGAMFGMVLFNHKTSKMKFRLLVPLSVVFQFVAFICLTNLPLWVKII